jgi:hypothetical protein
LKQALLGAQKTAQGFIPEGYQMQRHLLVLSLCLGSGCALLPAETNSARAAPPARPVLPVQITTASGTVCNAVRLDSLTVATAAHCIEDDSAVMVVEAERSLAVSSITSHPAFGLAAMAQSAGVDLARLSVMEEPELVGEVPIRAIEPGTVEIRVASPDGTYRAVPCAFLGRSGSIVELSCHVSLGWSGAPIVQNGALVGILSARGQAQTAGIAQMADARLLESF